jgi:integrase
VTYDVRFWDTRKNEGKRRPYEVRWVVAGKQHSRSFLTKALAESFRADLIKEARQGVPFVPATGMPESQARDVSWIEHARLYAANKWPRAAAKTRKSMVEALTTVGLAMFGRRRGRPVDELLRGALYGWAFNPRRDIGDAPSEVAAALDWIVSASLPVSSLRDLGQVRRVLDALTLRLDGTPAAATTVYRKRAVFYNALGFAVERKLLPANPIDQVQWSAPDLAETVDRRVVASPSQVGRLLTAIPEVSRRGTHLVAFFACLYYAGMRPSEVIALRGSQCVLPEAGWGRLELAGSEPRAGRAWTDDGSTRQARELKRRSATAIRIVPIPPELVTILRQHIDRYGLGDDGRLVRSHRGGPLQESAYRLVWANARKAGLTEAEADSPLARRPYDLRHAAASLWLNSGVPATEVARRLGHGVAVLLKVYANCIDGQEVMANDRIARALQDGARETLTPASGATGTPDSGPAGQVRDGSGGEEL